MYDWDHYEEQALDYLEGNLSDEQRRAFESFMESHPEVAQEVRSLAQGMPVLPAERVEFPDKEMLKRGMKRSLRWRQIGSFLGGAAAASVVIGLFGLLGSIGKIDDSIQYGERQLAEQIEEVYQETAKSVAAENDASQEVAENVVSDVISVPEKVVSSVDAYMGSVKRTSVVSDETDRQKTDEIEEVGLDQVVLKPLFADSRAILDPIALNKNIALEPVTLPMAGDNSLPELDNTDDGSTDGTKEAMRILTSLLAPFDDLLPIKRYSTEDERGIEIASFIRIGSRVE